MDNTGRVGNISASTSISSGNSGESSRGKTGNSYRVGNIGDTISGSNGGGKTSIAKTSAIAKSGISQTSTISIGSIKSTSISLGLSSSKSCKANHKSNLNHVHPVTVKLRIPHV